MGLAELETEEMSIRRSTSVNKEQERKVNVNKTLQLLQKSKSASDRDDPRHRLQSPIPKPRKQSSKNFLTSMTLGASTKNMLGGNAEAKLTAHGHFSTSPLKSELKSSAATLAGSFNKATPALVSPAPVRGPLELGESTAPI
mmetsp:Transcript_52719/g.146360  ORF Transcript_52719/g.146360 Transcript_52719/m.146360 type:complete len:142 (-) Transcript_52719:75-500(-)